MLNTTELFYLMCDGRNSLNDIVNLLTESGHDTQDIMFAMTRVIEDDNMRGSVNSRLEAVYAPA